MSTTVTWYVARNHLGEFNRGKRWVSDIADVRLHRKPGPAKAKITSWAKANPSAPVPELLEWRLDISSATVIDMREKTGKALARIAKRRDEAEKSRIEWQRKNLEKKIASAQTQLSQLKAPWV